MRRRGNILLPSSWLSNTPSKQMKMKNYILLPETHQSIYQAAQRNASQNGALHTTFEVLMADNEESHKIWGFYGGNYEECRLLGC
jgi:hypothetical protein